MTTNAIKLGKKGPKKTEKITCGTMDPAYNVACYYNAVVASKVQFDKDDLATIKTIKQLEGDDSFACAEDKVATLKYYAKEETQNLAQPVLLWNENSYGCKKSKKRTIHLDILGTTKSIAEATLLQVSTAILEEEGFKDLIIDINSIGSKDVTARFQKEISNYYKKNINAVSATCRHIFKKDSLAAHTCAIDEGDEIALGAPQAISFLNDEARTHFQEVLEFLETLNLPYKINNALVGHRGYSGDTIFTISASDGKGGNVIVAAGSRYNSLSKKYGTKKDAPAVGITLYLPSLEKSARPPKPLKKSSFFFIQIGFEAKLRSLEVIEILRKAKIPLYQSLSRDKLSAQLSIAEFEKFPYIIIMGQKEAMDNTLLVRNTNTRSQDTVPISRLPEYLRNIA
jgi:histidyl-tRNA synthetase